MSDILPDLQAISPSYYYCMETITGLIWITILPLTLTSAPKTKITVIHTLHKKSSFLNSVISIIKVLLWEILYLLLDTT